MLTKLNVKHNAAVLSYKNGEKTNCVGIGNLRISFLLRSLNRNNNSHSTLAVFFSSSLLARCRGSINNPINSGRRKFRKTFSRKWREIVLFESVRKKK